MALRPGARVVLAKPIALWRVGTPGTVVDRSRNAAGGYDCVVDLDSSGRLYFRADELHALEGPESQATAVRIQPTG